MKRRFMIPLTAIALVGCHDSKEATVIPKKFVASIEAFSGTSSRLELAADGGVTYLYNPRTFTAWEGTERTGIPIPAERWIAFRKQLDSAKVWSWQRKYDNPNIADGTVWQFEIIYADHKISSEGSNAYPSKEQFEAVCAAVQALIGDKRFPDRPIWHHEN